jgi:hypothetical protein
LDDTPLCDIPGSCGAPRSRNKVKRDRKHTQAESTFISSITLQTIGKMGELSVLIRLAKGEKVTLDEVEEQKQS